MTALEKVKIKLEIPKDDTSKDELLTLQIEDLTMLVMDYCFLKALPAALEVFIINKVVGQYKEEISSISRGDTSIHYQNKDFSGSEIAILNRYKKVIAR